MAKVQKEKRRKPKYGILSCVGYMYKMMWKYARGLVFVGIFTVPVSLAMSALALYVPSITLRYLEKSRYFSTVGLIILGLGLAEILLSLADKRIEIETVLSRHYIQGQMEYDLIRRWRDRDCFLEYDPEVQQLDERARPSHNATMFPLNFAAMVSAVLKFFLFGSIISLVNPWIILLLIGSSVVGYLASAWVRKREYETQDRLNIINKKINYLAFHIARNLKYGKDIRLYNFREYLALLGRRLLKDGKAERERLQRRELVSRLISFLAVLFRDGVAYAFLISKAVAGEIDAAQFVLYFSAVTQMADFVSKILGMWSGICAGAMRISDYRENLEVPDRMNRGQGIPLPEGAFSIEFRNVTFKYPQGEKNVLENISFKIEAGEKLALVGLNGAGKTTMAFCFPRRERFFWTGIRWENTTVTSCIRCSGWFRRIIICSLCPLHRILPVRMRMMTLTVTGLPCASAVQGLRTRLPPCPGARPHHSTVRSIRRERNFQGVRHRSCFWRGCCIGDRNVSYWMSRQLLWTPLPRTGCTAGTAR